MLGCFNPNLGQMWTKPNVRLKIVIKKCTVESESWSWVPLYIKWL